MQDAMVTARMSQEKKDAGNRVLKQLGQTASQAINELYDYLITKRENPCTKKSVDMKPGVRTFTPEQVKIGKEFLASFKLPANNRFATMTDDEIKAERLLGRDQDDAEAVA